MAAISSLIGGLALTAVGTGVQLSASRQATAAQEQGIAAQQRAEEARHKQMLLDSTRRRRELVRQGIIARSQALTRANSQGAAQSSVLPGAYGGISGTTNYGILGTYQSEAIGESIFNANTDLLTARRAEASAQGTAALGSGLQSLGGTLLRNMGTLNRLTS